MKLDLASLTRGGVFRDPDDGVWLVRGHEDDWGVFPTRKSAEAALRRPRESRRIADEALARSFTAFVASGRPHGSRSGRVLLGSVRSGLTLTLGQVWFIPAEKPYVEVEWETGHTSRANTVSVRSYTKDLKAARRILSAMRAREDKTFYRFARSEDRKKHLRHAVGEPLEEA